MLSVPQFLKATGDDEKKNKVKEDYKLKRQLTLLAWNWNFVTSWQMWLQSLIVVGDSKWQKNNNIGKFGDCTHLIGIRGTAVGVVTEVMTCKICSKALRPPPTWKATWSALFCRVKETERVTVGGGQRKAGWTGDYTTLSREGTFFLSYGGEGLKSETKWSLKYSCLISKVHSLAPPHNNQVSVKGKWSAGSS